MRKFILFFLCFLIVLPLSAQEATPEAEEALRLRPFTLEPGEISGVAPASWGELQTGSYLRGEGDNDQTYIIHISAQDVTLEEMMDPLLDAYGLEALPESSETYQSSLLDWLVYNFDFSPLEDVVLRVEMAIAEAEGRIYIVILQSFSDENVQYREEVFFPALDYFGLPLAEIYEALGYEVLSHVELENFGIASAYPAEWQEINPASYMRAEADFTTLLIQTSPDLEARDFAELLIETLGLALELPEEGEILKTSYLEWTIYRLDFTNEGFELSMMIALAESEALSYMVVLLCLAEEAETLHDRVLLPVLDITKPLN